MSGRPKLFFKRFGKNASPHWSTESADESSNFSQRSYSQPLFDRAHLQGMERQSSLPGTSDSNLQSKGDPEELKVIDEEAMNESYVCRESDRKHNSSCIVGPGGVHIPQLNHLKQLAPNGAIRVMCVTWNMASRSQSYLTKICDLVGNKDLSERPEVIAVSLQEIPATNTKYHQEAVNILSSCMKDSHEVFCWVRKWTQMLIVFIRSALITYASTPEWQFISSSTIVKPMRTKGAIAVTFHVFQCLVMFVACHLSHGPLVNRRNDYFKIVDTLKLTEPGKTRPPGGLFWFGDLNFRLLSRDRLDGLKITEDCKNPDRLFSDLLADDELTMEKSRGNMFEGFVEPKIVFPPTHKFVIGTDEYAFNRIPSYTDRVLYLTKDENRIRPVVYDSIWEENASDHKPVFAVFNMRVIDNPR